MVPEQEDQVEKDRQHIEHGSSGAQKQQLQVLGRREDQNIQAEPQPQSELELQHRK